MKHSLLFLLFSWTLVAGGQAMGPWSNTGPVPFPINVSGQVHGIGRISQIKFHPTDANKIYAATASGGLFYSADNGVNWSPISGTQTLPASSTSSVCIDYTDDQIIYLSSGDANYYGNDYGIYKSIDGGTTWNLVTTTIGTAMAVEILMDPTDHNTLVAATKNGVYKTTNGGSSWSLKQSGAFKDMKKKPGSNTRLYACTATAMYVSNNFGNTWSNITSGLGTIPSGNDGMRLAVSANNPSRVYLATTDNNGMIYRSSDSGTTFTNVYNSSTECLTCYDEDPTSGSQGDYNLDITANPANANELILVAHCVWRSTDAGATWSKRTNWYAEVHTDMHHIEWNPYDGTQLFMGNDGGIWYTTDSVATYWLPRSDGLATTEIYHAAQSPVVRDLISIGTQDNGELYYSDGIWRCNRGGDWGARSFIDYRDKGTVYYMENGNRRDLLPLAGDLSYNDPIIADNAARMEFVHSNINLAFTGKDSVFRCTNLNSATPAWSLIKASTEQIRIIHSCTADSNILYIVTTGDHVLRSDNALAASPTFVTLSTPSSTANAGSITTTRDSANVVFMTCGSSVYRSSNKGASWTNITGTGLSGLNIRRIIADEFSTNERLFVNAGAYVHYKDNSTTAWTNNNGLPTICNGADFMIYNNNTAASILRYATYGRGVWQCDINQNLPPFPEFTADKQNICPGDTVHFTQTIYGTYTSFQWTFFGGSPATSTTVNPAVVYNTPGTYDVWLKATNAWGSDTNIKVGYITVSFGSAFSLTEGFEETFFPPIGWSQLSASGGYWQQNGVGGYALSAQSAMFDNYYHDAGGQPDRLISDKVDASGIDSVRLTFDLAYAVYSSGYPDSLRVSVSNDCGDTWNSVYVKSGPALATSPDFTDVFAPAAGDWRTDTVWLNAYSGGSLQVSFDDIGHYGQRLFIDNVNIGMTPLAGFIASDTSICEGTTITYTVTGINATGWLWNFPGGTPSSSTANTVDVTYNTPGIYNATLKAMNDVGEDIQTKTGYITVDAVPVATVTPVGTTLTATGGTGTYQWFQDGVLIPGATGSSYTPTSDGAYTVSITTPGGCIDTSDIYLDLQTPVNGGVSIYPNPSNGVIHLNTTGINGRNMTVKCYDAAGKLVHQSSFPIAKGQTTIDWSDLAKGVYALEILVDDVKVGRKSLVVR